MVHAARLDSVRRLGLVVALLAGSSACLLMLASCNQPQSQARQKVLPRTSPPVLHAVTAKELREMMRDLSAQASQQVWMDIYTSGEPGADMSRMVPVADSMAQAAANRLPQTIASIQMDPKDRQVFLGLSKRLYDEAVVLKQQAQTNQLAPARATMNQITNTCNSCHTLFRDVAGPAS
jgi:hypothetical protein